MALPLKRRNMLMLLLAGGCALAIVLTLRGAPTSTTRELPEALAGEPDLYVRDAVITQFKKTGLMKYRLLAPQIRHFEDERLTRLLAPDLSLFNETQPPWKIRSQHGYIRQAQPALAREEVVFLRENVELTQAYVDGRRVRLRSPALYLYPDSQYAETDQDVIIDTDVGRTKAVGLKGDLQHGLLNLFSSADQRVHTIVLPGQFK